MRFSLPYTPTLFSCRLFFVEDWIESLKFGLSLWFLTYVGGWFNAMTMLIMSWVLLFTVPKVKIIGIKLTLHGMINDTLRSLDLHQ